MAKEADGAQMNAAKLKALQATIDKIEKDPELKKKVQKEAEKVKKQYGL